MGAQGGVEGRWVLDHKKKKENNMYSFTFCAQALYKISSS